MIVAEHLDFLSLFLLCMTCFCTFEIILLFCSTCLVHVYDLSHCGCRIETDVKPVSTDILVSSDGTVQHAIQLYTTVVCEMNLFTYPFVTDACPVALNGWRENSKFKYNLFNLRSEV